VGGGWSVASTETNDLDSVGVGESTTISPRMRDQMKFYMSRHMNKKKSERLG
jgi:predicted DNA-binding protein (MmcQ/YjbR family)